MLRWGLLLLAMTIVAGCESTGQSPPVTETNPQGPTNTQRAAYAASVHFPANINARDDLPITALINAPSNEIKLYNFSTRPLRNVDVWVNQAFVTHLDGIPARGSVTLHSGDFYNSLGSSLFNEKQAIRQIHVQSSEGVHLVWGPLSE